MNDLICKHCGCKIRWSRPLGGVHLEGSYRGKGRCGSESNLPYGYNAEPLGEPCADPCFGAPVRTDGSES